MLIFVLLFLHVLSLNVLSLFSFLFLSFFEEEEEEEEVLTIIERLLIELHLLVYNCTPVSSPNAASVYFSLQGSSSVFFLC